MMMDWSVTYWNGDFPLRIIASRADLLIQGVAKRWFGTPQPPDEVLRWDRVPVDRVLDVCLYVGDTVVGLRGMDNYWLDERSFGAFNDPVNRDLYGGPQEVSYHFDGEAIEKRRERPPEGVKVLRGVQVPDAVAQKIGLL